MTSSKPKYLSNVLPPNAITLGVRASTYEFGGDTNFQSVTPFASPVLLMGEPIPFCVLVAPWEQTLQQQSLLPGLGGAGWWRRAKVTTGFDWAQGWTELAQSWARSK